MQIQQTEEIPESSVLLGYQLINKTRPIPSLIGIGHAEQ
jgi:hypothetical protein